MIIGRRGFIGGLLGMVAAPAIVRAASIMPVSVLPPLVPGTATIIGVDAYGNRMVETIPIRPDGWTRGNKAFVWFDSIEMAKAPLSDRIILRHEQVTVPDFTDGRIKAMRFDARASLLPEAHAIKIRLSDLRRDYDG